MKIHNSFNISTHEIQFIIFFKQMVDSLFEVTISPEKIISQEKKSIALYSSAYTLCRVYS